MDITESTDGKQAQGRSSQLGFTLLELTVSIAIIGALGGFLASSSFVMLRTANVTNAQAELAVETTKSTRWLVRDIHRATTIDLVDGGAAVASADLTWNDAGAPTTCTYDLSGTSLRRTCPGDTFVVANGVSALQFTMTGDLVTAAYTVTSTRDATVTENVTMNVVFGGG